jgi:hypothetical protein
MIKLGVTKRLISYYPPSGLVKWIGFLKSTNGFSSQELFIDSGAFTVWSRGVTINLIDYIEYVKTIQSLGWKFFVCANLDVLPEAVVRDIESSAKQGWENLKIMQDNGLDPIPVYHYGEPLEWLDRISESGCQWIGFGGLVGMDRRSLMSWLDGIFRRIEKYPNMKVHGFGITSLDVLKRFPWYSVDSTSWIKSSSYGALLYFDTRLGKLNALPISNERRFRKKDHLLHMSPIVQETIQNGLTLMGIPYTLEELSLDWEKRLSANVKAFQILEKWFEDYRCAKEYLVGGRFHES